MSTSTQPPSRDALPGARHALILLLLINLFNYIDRFVLSAVLPKIEAEFVPTDPAAKTKMGALTTVFMVSYMILAPVFGVLGDRMSRWRLVAIGVVVWSAATGGSGLAVSYAMLLLTRCFVGVGEAAYGPVAPGVISDMYPVERRGSVLSWFYMAIPVGSALGFMIGGQVAATAWGWRGAFLVVVLPGLLLGLWAARMKDPPRGLHEKVEPKAKHRWRDYLVLLRIRSYVYDTLGMTAMTFVLGGVATWMPSYVYEREGRFILDESALDRFGKKAAEKNAEPSEELRGRLRGMADGEERSHPEMKRYLKQHLTEEERGVYTLTILESSEAKGSLGLESINTYFGAIVVLSGLFGTLLGGIAGDRLRPRFSGSYFLVAGAGMLVAFPLFLLVLVTPFPLAWLVMFAAVFCLFFNTGPTNTILANVSPPGIRASAFAINILIIHALGDAISPTVIGILSDVSNLERAFFLVAFLIPVSGICWLLGMPHLAEDTAKAPSHSV